MQSELEDRTVKITTMKQNKGKNDKRLGASKRPLGH